MKIIPKLYFVFFYFFGTVIFCQSDPLLASKISLIPNLISLNSAPKLHFGFKLENNTIQAFSGIQFQPTTNLIIGGIISPIIVNNDINLYHQLNIGYTPILEWRKTTNLINIGIHRKRFFNEGDKRWYSFSTIFSTKISNINFHFSWNRLFTQKWERNTIHLTSNLSLLKNIFFRPGIIAYFTPSFEYLPFIFITINI